jgi:tetratricopeptide (TPR) repeat protein
LLKQWEMAQADLTQAVRLRPTFFTALIERARDSSPAAIGKKDLNYVVRVRPDWARGYYERAAFLKRSASTNETMSDLDRAIEIDPGYVDAYKLRARIRRDLKDFNGAIEDLNQVLRHDPDDVIAYRDRGYLRSEVKDYRGAVGDFSRAIELATGSPQTEAMGLVQMYAARSLARYEIGDGIGSHNDHQQANDLSVTCRGCNQGSNLAKAKKADSIFQKAVSLALKGDTTQARLNFEEALRLFAAAGRMSDCEKTKYEMSKL